MFRDKMIRVSACSLVLFATMAATATGPIEQNSSISGIPRLLSHVNISNTGGLGSGTIIDKKVDANGDGWLCVLTADHVVRGATNHVIGVGSGTLTTYGGADSWYLSHSPPGTRRMDIAMLGIRIGNVNNNAGAAAAYNSFAPVSLGLFGPAYDPANPNAINRTIFTEHGYGDSGSFVDGGMQHVANNGNVRRFQNNQIERWARRNNANYDYWGVQWDFNVPANAGPLLSEGLMFAGDSGGAYCTSQLETKIISAAFRENIHVNADGTGDLIPSIPAGSQLGFWVNNLIAVNTFGNSVEGGAFNAFGTRGAGVPMTADALLWVNEACMAIPTPSVGAMFTFGMILMAPRRRR